ncbi:hypothetical protein AB0M19_25385 [Streptomyces sp. NPDC051920]|uniref:hypothetical protein n=1 Tax=Streptomyces sp. NPDC051920 TaxID=3155523 RepID=UPI00341FAB41
MHSIIRKVANLAVVTGAFAAATMAGAPAANAEPVQHGCAYPYVCFYVNRAAVNAGHPAAKFQVVTSGFQDVTSRDGYIVLNTRNDDVAYLRSNAGALCVGPNTTTVMSAGITIDGIRISSSATC